MLNNVDGVEGLPKREDILGATKSQPLVWDPLRVLKKSPKQSQSSFEKQQFALKLGLNAVNKYSTQFSNNMSTKGVLINGAPGAGKSFVLQALGLYGMTMGLCVMSTSIVGVRANALGGYHLHRLMKWDVGKSGNLFCLAEVCQTVFLYCSIETIINICLF